MKVFDALGTFDVLGAGLPTSPQFTTEGLPEQRAVQELRATCGYVFVDCGMELKDPEHPQAIAAANALARLLIEIHERRGCAQTNCESNDQTSA